jgi:hypothetical protein
VNDVPQLISPVDGSKQNNDSDWVAMAFPRVAESMNIAGLANAFPTGPGSASWEKTLSQFVGFALDHPNLLLKELVPVLPSCAFEVTDMRWTKEEINPLGTRSVNCVFREMHRRNLPMTWAGVSEFSVDHILKWQNAGVKTARDLLRVAIEIGSRLPVPEANAPDRATNEIEDLLDPWTIIEGDEPPIRVLTAWARFCGFPDTLGGALDAASRHDTPKDVVEALETVRSVSVKPSQSDEVPLASLIENLLSALGERNRFIVEKRFLSSPPSTLEEVGTDIGLTRERVRQIQSNIRTELETLLELPQFRTINWASKLLQARFGLIAPIQSSLTTEIVIDLLGEEPQNLHLGLLLFLAGPYQKSDWAYQILSIDDIESVLAAETDADGRIADDPSAQLSELGVRAGFHEQVLNHSGRFRKLNDYWFDWHGSAIDKAVAVLSARAEPMTAEEIVTTIGEGHNARGIRARLAEDPRVVRIQPGIFALRSWGHEEYSGIFEEIAERIEGDGGATNLRELVNEIVQTFGVSELSVLSYSKSPMFIIGGEMIHMRLANEMVVHQATLASSKGWFLTRGKAVTVISVDGDALRGSGRVVNPGTTASLGVQPGQDVTYKGAGFSIRVSWPMSGWQGGNFGSIRDACLMVGAQEGDRLRFEFDPRTLEVEASKVDESLLKNKPSLESARELFGGDLSDISSLISDISEMFECNPADVGQHLAARGDHEVRAALPLVAAPQRLSKGWIIS